MDTRNQRSEVLTLRDAAKLLRLNPATVYVLARTNKVPGRKVGRAWRFSRTAILETLKQPERTSQP